MAETGHRFYPKRWYPTWIRYAHEARYEWACTMVKGMRVLDGACGTGYGSSQLLAAGAARVDGVDLSAESVAEATQSYAAPHLAFQEADLCRLEAPDESYDVVVSFESIEHVDDDAQYVSEMRRVLRRGGTFLCSTPNRTVTNPGATIQSKPYNPFHVREYTLAELRDKLSTQFKSVQMLGQAPWTSGYCESLERLSARSPMSAVRLHQINKMLHLPFDRKPRFMPAAVEAGTEPEGLVAICS
jgi:ubiquinone/menaquinone biosynthesis C-methylase UbiE